MKIVEVGPRDGLQNESELLTVEQKIQLIQKLGSAGLKFIEVGAFVSPKWVPQMQNSFEVVKEVQRLQASKVLPKSIVPSVLVPNERGMEDALASGIRHIAVFGAASQSFSKRNINCTIEESFSRFANIIKIAKKNKISVRGYLSTCFGCPFEGKVPADRVVKLAARLHKLGVVEISIGDTIGVATPKQVREVLAKVKKKVPVRKIAMHFHDTRGTALANVLASLDLGVRVFDSSIGSLGGCPYAPGASGNLATEDLAYMAEGMGLKTKIDISQLVEIKKWLERMVGRDLPSHVGRSGLPMPKKLASSLQ